ncbi:MAG: diguanylate cyclase, partial [Nitrosomonas sp.]|nr:diguanylate cyclase [Nitrosomonas sp.]
MLTRDSRKISIIGGLLLIGVTLTTGLAVYEVMRQQIESSLGRGLDVALQGKAHLLESQIEKGLADTHAVVTRPFLVQTLKQIIDYPNNINTLQDLQRNVDSLKLNEFTAAKVFDLHGNVLSQTGHFSEEETPSLPLIKYHHTFLLWNGEFILHTREDILDLEHNPIGSITTEKSLPQLTRSFEEIRSIGKTGEFILCAPPKQNSLKMACLISQIEGVKFQHISQIKDNKMLPMNDALDGKSGVMSVKDYRKISVIEAYAPLSMGLGMILKLDEDELFEPVTDKLKIIILYLTGLILAEILLLNWFV